MSAADLAAGGVDHAALTVRDLDVSQEFYHRVLGLTPVFDFGTTRILIHRRTGFTLALVHHDDQEPGGFAHTRVGLDHLGFGVDTRATLVRWEQHLRDMAVVFTPIRDMEFGHHLNFRDPDDIALELSAPNDLQRQALELLAANDLTDDQLRAAAGEHFGMGDLLAAADARPRS
ncbi:MAG: VOC family protein [Candidatus Nanopelagicales bacterium]|jgi:catechol 2,3-dioxygenase-like lactoylglutathione lyase family enzyme